MIGNQIANFRILEKLGEGGMGVVFRAVDVQLDRPVAIKMLNADLARDPQVVERFRTEARAQANLNHVNLATLYAFLVDQGNAFMVMEFVEGETFEQIINRRGPIAPEDAVPWFKQALLGIGAAHRMGIVHRDIKPGNLMLNRQGIVKVMDFGIAKVMGTRGMTRTGMQLGTLAYMSPEQIQNRQIDVRTDIYALGITLYQMLSGHVPFESDSDFEIMNSHITAPPPPLTRMYPYAPVRYQNVVMKALEKSPDNRYQTVEEFGAALEHPENVPAPTGAAPMPPGVRPTVVEMPRPPLVATRAAGKITWDSRYTAVAAIVAAALILLAILMFVRKLPVAQAPTNAGVVWPPAKGAEKSGTTSTMTTATSTVPVTRKMPKSRGKALVELLNSGKRPQPNVGRPDISIGMADVNSGFCGSGGCSFTVEVIKNGRWKSVLEGLAWKVQLTNERAFGRGSCARVHKSKPSTRERSSLRSRGPFCWFGIAVKGRNERHAGALDSSPEPQG